MSNLSQQIQDALSVEGNQLVSSISNSITANRQRASGGTQASLHSDVNADTLTIYGMSNIFSLEDGVSPMDVRGLTLPYFAKKIMQWSLDKGISFFSNHEQKNFAYLTAKKIQKQGSVLFRNGGRKDVYSDKADVAVKKLSATLTGIIIDYKILK